MMPNQILGMLQQFKSNPMQMLMQRRMNLPQNVPMNDPDAILNHLLQTGQISECVQSPDKKGRLFFFALYNSI